MHHSLFCTIFFLLIYSYFHLCEGFCEAGRQTVLVLGHSDYNLLKVSFVQRIINDTANVEKAFDGAVDAATFLTFHSDKSGTLDKQLNHHQLVQEKYLKSQTCTVTITTKGTDEMSLEELQILREMIYYVNSGLIVIEIGNKATQTTVILEHSTFCWGTTSLHSIDAPNTVLLCNDVKISETPLLSDAKIKTLFENDNDQLSAATTTITWPSIFPSVMAAESASEKKSRGSRKTAQKSARELYYKKGRKAAINWPDEPEVVDIEHLKKKDKKVACKYRKSCYETGILPNLKAEKTVYSTTENDAQEEAIPEAEDIDEDDTLSLKVLCKYRPSCYAEIGMDMNEANQKKSKGIFIAKKSAFLESENRPKKKETVREIARKAVKEVEMKDRENPKAKISTIEKHLTETEEKLEMKNRCKYRKSCYESGKLPEVDSTYSTPSWLSIDPLIDYANVYLNKGEKDEDEKSFDEKNENQRKLFCKYRKSCYDTGIAPKIDQTQKFHFEEVVERSPAEIPLQVRCKYRKSCYETGILPDFKKPAKHVEAKPKPLPVTVEDLKLHCKYRKSCYREKALEVPAKVEEEEEDEKMSNERILVEELTDDDDQKEDSAEFFRDKVEEVAEEVVEEAPKKAKKLKEKLPTILPDEETAHAKKKPKSRQPPVEEETEKDEEKSSRKSKKSKAKESEPTPTKKSKNKKSTEVVEDEEVPEHISAFDLKDEEEKEEEEIIVDEPVPLPPSPSSEPQKKDTKPKKPKKKYPHPKNELEASDLENQPMGNEKEEEEDREAVNVPLKEKLYCKYRKSCYESKVPPQISNDPLVWHYKKNYLSFSAAAPTSDTEISEERWNQLNEQQRKVECKYRQSCYETRKLPPILTTTDGIWHMKHVFAGHEKHVEPDVTPEEWEKRSERQKKVVCKYRKSCYDSGKLPPIEGTFATKPRPTEAKETPKNWAERSEADRKVECKYRKSCYESGILPSMAPATVETVIESIHDNPKETLQQRCKYRKSCYAAAAELKKAEKEQRSKPGIIDEETLVVKNAKVPHHIRKEAKSAEKEEADTSSEEKQTKKADKPQKKQKQKASASKKSKEKADEDDSREEEYKEIPRKEEDDEDKKPKVNATELAKNLTTSVKIACKYRQSCYVSAVHDHLPPEQIMRMRGVKCSKYRLSCREQLGLPPLIRAPIGPNGRKLCRKKKPEQSLKM